MDGIFASAKPVYYRTERVYCRTVDYQGNWQAWWQTNRRHYY